MKRQSEELPPEVALQWHIFRKSLPLQVALQESLRLLGKADGKRCLEVGAVNGVQSYQLRRAGGTWQSVAFSDRRAVLVGAALGEEVHVVEDGKLPFEDKAFDALVVSDALERVRADEAFIEECHRVLRPDGKLIVSMRHLKTYSIVRPLRSLLGLTPERQGLARGGYTESDLFFILKNGFDVMNVRSYCRLFMALTHTFVESVVMRQDRSPTGNSGAVRRAYALAAPFYRLAYQLDMLLFLGRGFILIALAKRRAWRPRTAPVLTDGRSLTEAVLTRPSR